jgi:hypothetical protein
MVKCKTCGVEFDTAPVYFPECPECIRSRMTVAGGIQPHHTLAGATTAPGKRPKSHAAMDGQKIFDFMAYSPGTEPAGSGCYLVSVLGHGSINAVCHKPLGQIRGPASTRPRADTFPPSSRS